MKRRSRAQSSSLFLMELMIAILFFTISSAICVQFFVKSHLFSEQSQQLNQGVAQCSSVAEVVDTSDSLEQCVETLEAEYEVRAYTDGSGIYGLTVFYDADDQACGEADAVYALKTSVSQEESMLVGKTSYETIASGEERVIYELDVEHYLQGGVTYEE